MTIPHGYVGIDISKDYLSVFSQAQLRSWACENKPEAIEALLDELGAEAMIVFEATSVCDRKLRRAIGRRGLRGVRVNPRKARRFAQAAGFLAKTDRVDPRALAAMGQALDLANSAPLDSFDVTREELVALIQRRRQLVEMRAREKTRLKQVDCEAVIESLEALLGMLNGQIRDIEKAIRAMIAATPDYRLIAGLLQTAPGIGWWNAAVLVAEMPELGTRNRRSIAALAGLAPIACDSGKYRGKRRIWGGRRHIRQALYIAALAAKRADQRYKAIYEALLARGKTKKQALIAIARHLIVGLNAMLRNKQPYMAHHP